MRKLFYTVLAIATLSCSEESINAPYDIYHEWRWEATYLNKETRYESAAELDTTYYYDFQQNGLLQVMDIEKQLQSELPFTINQDNLLTIDNIRYRYFIGNDTLTVRNLDGIISWTTIFKIEK